MKPITLTLLAAAATALFVTPRLSAEPIILKPTQFEEVAYEEFVQKDGDLMWLKWGARDAVVGQHRHKVTGKTQVQIPASGNYFLWVKYSIHPVRSKPFSVSIGNHLLPFAWLPWGEEGDERAEIYSRAIPSSETKEAVWTCQEISLDAGTTTLELTTACNPPEKREGVIPHPPVVWEIQITNDSSYAPTH